MSVGTLVDAALNLEKDGIRKKMNEVDLAIMALFYDNDKRVVNDKDYAYNFSKLVKRRSEVSREMGAFKKKYQLPIHDKECEDRKVAELISKYDVNPTAIRELYKILFALSRSIQQEVMDND